MTVVKADLSLMAKLSSGKFPIELKTGRYLIIDEEDRLCTISNTNVVETEYHFLFDCSPLQAVRSCFCVEHIKNFEWFILLPDAEKVKYLYSKEMIKYFAELLENLYYTRRNII